MRHPGTQQGLEKGFLGGGGTPEDWKRDFWDAGGG